MTRITHKKPAVVHTLASANESAAMSELRARQRVKATRPPLRTLREIADSLGVSSELLGNRIAEIQGSPDPKLLTGTKATTGRKVWYDPREVVKWWRSLPAEQRLPRVRSRGG